MSRAVFQALGSLVGGVAAIWTLGSIVVIRRYPPHSTTAVIPLALIALLLIFLAIGVYRANRWVALALSMLTIGLAAWFVKQSIHSTPWSWNGAGYWIALLLMIPPAFTFKFWRSLEPTKHP